LRHRVQWSSSETSICKYAFKTVTFLSENCIHQNLLNLEQQRFSTYVPRDPLAGGPQARPNANVLKFDVDAQHTRIRPNWINFQRWYANRDKFTNWSLSITSLKTAAVHNITVSIQIKQYSLHIKQAKFLQTSL